MITTYKEFIEIESKKDYYIKLKEFVINEYNNYKCYPPYKNIFHAFSITSLKDTKVVILGQDPYHGTGEAHGYAFSCLKTPIPPSLKNIYKELYDDLGIDTRTGRPFGMHYDIDAPEDDNIDEMLTEENSLIPQVNIRDIDLDKSNYKFALWVSGEVAAYYRNYDAAEEALDNLKGQGFDLAIIDADSNETLYADWY